MVQSPTAEEFTALLEALTVATQRGDEASLQSRSLAGELRVVRAERDLLKERLNKFMHQIFAAKSEVSGLHQKDMFFNEAEALGAAAQPAQEEVDGEDEKAIAAPRPQACQARSQAARSDPAARGREARAAAGRARVSA